MTASVWNHFWGTTIARTPHYNGIGRFTQQLQRITFKFCKSSGASKGVRDFIEKDLIHYARSNPGVVVYLKPRRHRGPVLKAEYLNGEEEYLYLAKRPREEIVRWVDHYTTRSGQPTARLMKTHHTHHLSIQGVWTPWTHRHPDTFTRTYPDEEASQAEKIEKTATDELREIAERLSIGEN
ncbi:39S ribosomal protein L43, mitochondrial-like [Hyalella azteca]|uniref:Large ribosomal subunit protein mL43 n=1 Tax=Hyalella azteca TaxID=294128 RepID=A0A8B7P8F6_HYAAZ|nr:39S ribosomal protein L43, mitochondrial-like [Hyalella azteca]